MCTGHLNHVCTVHFGEKVLGDDVWLVHWSLANSKNKFCWQALPAAVEDNLERPS